MSEPVEICLCMIVKNESRIIARCLRAAKPFITCWSILDTGSTDDTRDIVRKELEGIPGQLKEEPWVNFGFSRTRSFSLAQQFLADKAGVDFKRSWCLLLDADHELEDHGFKPGDLCDASHMLVQKSGLFRYPNIRFIRADQAWECIGVTHEYWGATRTSDSSRSTLTTLEIVDHEDGGTRSEKWTRDEALLRQGVIGEPENERYHFYLAQTLEGIGKKDEAIELYRKRAAMGGYHEEKWMAQYRMARLLLSAGRHQEGEAELARAWQQAPHRAEPLYWLARHHRCEGRNYLAMMYAQKAAQIPLPYADALFVEGDVYGQGLVQEEIAINAFYTRQFPEGMRANELCLVNLVTREQALQNQCYYALPLGGVLERGTFSDVPEALRTHDGIVYRQGTNSICDDIVSTRVMSYDHKGGRDFWSRCPDGKFRTETVLSVAGGEPFLVDSSIEREMWPQSASILGLEDWRLFRHRGRVWFVANCCTTPQGGGIPQVAIGRLSEDLHRVDKLLAPRFKIDPSWCEKNWQPLPEDVAAGLAPEGDWIGVVYAYDPFTVIYVNAETGDVYEAKRGPEVCRKRWRGSAPPIDVGGLLIGIVHDVSYFESGNIYTHRFVAMSPELDLIAYSPSFFFEQRGIEYTGGMKLDTDGNIRIVYTVDEHHSKWLRVPVEQVINLLKYNPISGKETVNVEFERSAGDARIAAE